MKKFNINMIEGKARVFNQFTQEVVAVDYSEAMLLKHFILHCFRTKSYLNSTEVLDFQRYKLIKNKVKVNALLQTHHLKWDFVFPVNIN